MPESATDDGALSIQLQPSLAAGLVDGLAYLEHYPYECNEQTTSRFLPNLFTVRALRELGIEDPALESNLNYQLGIGVQTLVSRQNPDGGWGYWPQQESTPFITTYVLWGLWNANELGYKLDSSVFDRAATYLDGQFEAPDEVNQEWMLNEMAFMHYVLAQMGRGDAGRMSTLYDVRERMASYGKAFLAMAMDTRRPQRPTRADAAGQPAGQRDHHRFGRVVAGSGHRLPDHGVEHPLHGHCAGRLPPDRTGAAHSAQRGALAHGCPPGGALGLDPGERLEHHQPHRLDGLHGRAERRLRLEGGSQRRRAGRRPLHGSQRAGDPAPGNHGSAAGRGEPPALQPQRRAGPALLHHLLAVLPGCGGRRPHGAGDRNRAALRA